VTVVNLLNQAQKILQANNIKMPRLEAEMLLSYILGWERYELYINRHYVPSDEQNDRFFGLIKLRSTGKPIQYIMGYKEFMGLRFYVDKSVLIPRCDTEVLVEHIIKHSQSRKDRINILEIGTGSGCIAVSIAYYAKNAYITAVDISKDALKIARQNAQSCGVGDRINFIHSNIFEELNRDRYGGYFDVMVSNPPYIPTEDIKILEKQVSEYEPQLALDGGIDGLNFYRMLAKGARPFLKEGGLWAVEVGYNQSSKVREILKNNGSYDGISFLKDLSGIDRVVLALLEK
jgi:release factor glutamine methyltransferase